MSLQGSSHDWQKQRIKHIHFVGIGGIGMCGIAEVLLNDGYIISGSDVADNANIRRLTKLGAKVHLQHARENIDGADVVVQSSAILPTNPEIIEAKSKRIPVVARAQMLAELMRFRHGIAIAGTHGKTTTTSLIACVLAEAGLDPTYVIGGVLNGAGSNAKLGRSPYLVAEADESDASFLCLQPMMSVVTNIDYDHMSTYLNDPMRLQQAFIDFLHHLPFYGLAVLCIDDPIIRELVSKINRPQITYGFSEDADVMGFDFTQSGTMCEFKVKRRQQNDVLTMQLNMPGKHNALNALAALAIAQEIGIQPDAIQRAFQQFAGVNRRFTILGELPVSEGAATVVDDYGHHPREIAATLAAARGAWPDRRIVLVFQPHRYSRTAELFEDFSQILAKADELLMLDVYSAGEDIIAGADSRALCRSIRTRGQVEPIYVGDISELPNSLYSILKANDVVLMQGAGSISSAAHQMVANGAKKNDL